MSAPVSGTLDDPEHDREAKFAGNFGHRLEMASLNLYGLIQIVRMNLFLQARFKTCAIGVLDPEGIARRKRLAKGDETTVTLRRSHAGIDDLCECRRALEPDRRNLRQADG